MDFDIGNILYIVITLVAVIVGVLGKKKKPTGDGSGAPESQSRPGFLENLERVLQMGQEGSVIQDLQEFEEDVPLEEDVQMEPVSEYKKAPGILEEYERLMNSAEEGERMTEVMEVVDMEYETGTDYFEVVKDFDAGAAIVYSTIINRLEY
jgi:hypothetical protein